MDKIGSKNLFQNNESVTPLGMGSESLTSPKNDLVNLNSPSFVAKFGMDPMDNSRFDEPELDDRLEKQTLRRNEMPI